MKVAITKFMGYHRGGYPVYKRLLVDAKKCETCGIKIQKAKPCTNCKYNKVA